MSTIFNNLELVIYLVIILAGILGSLGGKKKKPAGIPVPSDADDDPDMYMESDDGSDMDEDYSYTKPAPATTTPHQQPQPRKRHAMDDIEWERKALAERAVRDAMKAAAREAARTAPPAPPATVTVDTPPVNALAAQARAGFVWSEILQPPVSMR